MTDDRIERIEADADVAARYLVALLKHGVERADAVSLTCSYMSSRTIMQGQQPASPPRRGFTS
jgi:hypothetical protein